MVWWFVIPIATIGAKLLYDFVQDDSSSSSTPDNAQHLCIEKSRRTNTRKDVVRSTLIKHRTLLVKKLTYEIGECVRITKKVNDEYTVSFDKINEIISSMQSMMHPSATGSSEGDLYNIKFCDIDDTIAGIVNMANSKYGELSGINAQDEYVEDQDAFIASFKSAAKDAS